MKLSDAEVRDLFQRKTAREESRAADCLGEDALVSAARGTLDAKERERAAAHIAHCSDCAREFRIARALAPLESEAKREFSETRRAAWLPIAASGLLANALPSLVASILTIQQLRREVAELRSNGVVRASGAPDERRAGGAHHSAEEVQELRMTIAELSQPQTDVPIVDLDADVTRGANEPVAVISADIVTLILHLPQDTSAAVEIEVLDGGGAVVATANAPAQPGRGSITLALHRKILGDGKHAIRVRSAGQTSVFHVRIESP